jgi:hypothetical protein
MTSGRRQWSKAFLPVAVALVAACPSPRSEDTGSPAVERLDGPSGGRSDGAPGPSAESDGPSAADGSEGTGDTCTSGFHVCRGVCVQNSSVENCGVACEPCPTIEGGAAVCDGVKCSVTCPPGKKPCLKACVDQAAVCANCPPGQNPCGGLCVDARALTACGPSCTPCPTSPNGDTSCDGETCSLKCKPGFHRCGEACLPDDGVASCGQGCSPCIAPAGGTATCVNGQCDFQCAGNAQKCNSQCIPAGALCNGACAAPGTRACGNTCVTGNCCDDNQCSGSFACVNNTCSQTQCKSGYKLCKGACIPSASCCDPAPCENNCGDTGTRPCNDGSLGACSAPTRTCCPGTSRQCENKCGQRGSQPCQSNGTYGPCSVSDSSCDGEEGRPCTANRTCNRTDLACSAQATCVPCGGQNQQCCGGTAGSLSALARRCRGKTVCVQGSNAYPFDTCVPCGGSNDECCVSSSGTASCDTGAGVCAYTNDPSFSPVYPGNCQN